MKVFNFLLILGVMLTAFICPSDSFEFRSGTSAQHGEASERAGGQGGGYGGANGGFGFGGGAGAAAGGNGDAGRSSSGSNRSK